MTKVIEAPEGIEFDLVIYMTSDETGLEVAARIGGLPTMTEFSGDRDPATLAKALSLPALASDWRLMTRGEVADYKRRMREDGTEED